MRALVLAVFTLAACVPGPTEPVGDDPIVGVPTVAPPDGLRRFQSCDAVQAHLTDVAVEMLLQSRYTSYHWGNSAFEDAAPTSDSDGAPSDYSTTNVQEQGVDELDLVKTDGTHLFIAQDSELSIVRSWPIDDTALVATVPLEGYPRGLFLRDDTVLVISNLYGQAGDDFVFRGYSGTRVTWVDVS